MQLKKQEKANQGLRTLVYGVLDHGGIGKLVFIPEPEANRLANIHTAIGEAKTWGDFCSRMTPNDLKEILEPLEEIEEVPHPDDPFDSGMLPGFCDGDWPTWPEQEMMQWLPQAIWSNYGERQTSVHNGWYIVIDPSHTAAIVGDLERAGYACRCDDKLIKKACGD